MEALLLIDIQKDYFTGGKYPLAGMNNATRIAREVLENFRKEQKMVIFIQHINQKQGSFFFLPNTEGADIHPLVCPKDGEPIFIKHFPNSFRETGLDEYLKSKKITRLHLVGAQTNMCIDTTARAGFDLGYEMVIHKNACAARSFLGTRIIHYLTIKTLGSVFAKIV